MRIMEIITLSQLGGAQSVVANLANSLVSYNEVIVVAGKQDGKLWNILDNRVKKITSNHLVREISPINDTLAFLAMVKLYFKYKPDVIHLHSSKAGILGRLAFPTKKVIYTVHGFDSIRNAYRKLLPLEKKMQNFCNTIVAVSQYDLNNLKEEGIKRNLHLVYNGIKHTEDNNIKLELNKKYKKVVLCIARVAKPKRLDIFLATAKELPQYAFVWIGNQKEESTKPSNVYFLGNIPNASRYCIKADLFMLSSDYEGLPMVIIEAMSFGKPIVASNVGGISEIVKNGINGYTVPNASHIFAQKISSILRDEQKCKAFGQNSLKIFQNELTDYQMANKYFKIYKEICNRK